MNDTRIEAHTLLRHHLLLYRNLNASWCDKDRQLLPRLQDGAPPSIGSVLDVVALLSHVLVLADLTDERVEGVIHAHARLGGGLHERDAVLLGHVACLWHIDGPGLQVALVSHQHHRHLLGVLYPLDLLPICSCKGVDGDECCGTQVIITND